MLRRFILNLAAPVLAIAFAVLVSSAFLLLADVSPWDTYRRMADYGTQTDSLISTLNRAIPLYIAGIAVAIGFKMGLFNIGVEGQYRIAALVSAGLGAKLALPGPLHVTAIIVIAVVSGMAWMAIPVILKVTRGVHEVISTIMMNAIASGITAWLLSSRSLLRGGSESSLTLSTDTIPESGRFPSLDPVLETLGVDIPTGSSLHGFLVIAILLGAGYYVLIWRTRFGYELRATGHNPFAAEVGGINPRRMAVSALFLSSGVAGLIGLSYMLGSSPYRFDTDFPQEYGYDGIAVALLGRNHPVGIGIGALLFAFLDRSAQILDLDGIPKEIVVIMRGVIVISVVIAYEMVRRYRQRQEEGEVTHATDLSPKVASA
jgi:general nucleoside transport system permease protein